MAKKAWSDKGISQDALRARQENKNFEGQRKQFNKVSYLKEHPMFVPKDGVNKVRIVQPLEVEDLGYYGLDVHFHRDVGVEKGDYLCLKRMLGNACYQCDQQTSELWDTNPDLAKTYYPDHRILMWVIDLNLKKGDKNYGKVLLWSCPKTLARDILGQSHKLETDVYTDVSHPKSGVAVYFKRSGKGRRTEYTNVQLAEKSLSLNEKILDQMKEFFDILVVPTYEEVKNAAEGHEAYDENPPVESYEVDEEHDETMDAEELWETDDATEETMEDAVDTLEEDSTSTEDCFQKEFDQWTECDTCSKREDCKPKPKKTAKVKRTPKKSTKETTTPEPKEEPEDKGKEVRNKLKKMISRARKG